MTHKDVRRYKRDRRRNRLKYLRRVKRKQWVYFPGMAW